MKFIKEIGRDPRIDWFLILLVSVVTAAALAIGGYYLYNAVTSGTAGEKPSAASEAPKLDEDVITSVIGKFKEKEVVSVNARKGYASTTDPSI